MPKPPQSLSKPMTLGESLPLEIARVRDTVLPDYLVRGELCQFAVTVMRHALDLASKATSEGDVAGMLRAHEALKGMQL